MKTWHLIAAVVLVVAIVLYLSRNKIKAALTRGYQNNNPGNIEDLDGKMWIGQVKTTDPPFKRFVSMPYGYRALWIDLRSKINSGLTNITSIITKYAPPKENDTAAYIADVAKKVGVAPTAQISFSDKATMRKLVAAISQHENGIPANMDDVDAGYNLLTI